MKVHDFTVHLVYSYFTLKEAPKPGFVPPANPNLDKFRQILADLAALKAKLKEKGIDTQGVPLGVHPGLKDSAGGAGFSSDVQALLTRHVSLQNLSAMAFMGLPDSSPQPWIFVAARNQGDATFAPFDLPTIGLKTSPDVRPLRWRPGRGADSDSRQSQPDHQLARNAGRRSPRRRHVRSLRKTTQPQWLCTASTYPAHPSSTLTGSRIRKSPI